MKVFSYNIAGTQQTHYVGALSEAGRRVYVYPDGADTCRLLYDFAASEGDTIAYADDAVTVRRTTTVRMGGENRRAVCIDVGHDATGWWIEGVGSTLGPLNATGFGAAGNGDHVERCEVGGREIFSFTSFYMQIDSEGAWRTLPLVSLATPDSTAITSKDVWQKACTVEVRDTSGAVLLMDTLAQLKGRGNTTWNEAKKPYAIKLSAKQPVLGMPKHKRWVLLANAYDRTHLKNAAALWMGHATSDRWNPHGQHVVVTLNGDTLGLYYLCEQIRVDKNRLAIDEMEETDVAEPEVTGGYLLEMDVNYDEVNKFHTAMRGLPVMVKSPDDDVMTQVQLDYIRQWFDSVEHVLYDSAVLNREYAIGQMLDLESFADYLLWSEVTVNYELRHPKSVYCYKPRGGRLTMGPMWDYDWAFDMHPDMPLVCDTSLWYAALLTMPTFRNLVVERWQMMRPHLGGVIEYIDSLAVSLRSVALADRLLWPQLTINGNEDMEFDDAVADLKVRIRTRLAQLDALVPMLATDVRRVVWQGREPHGAAFTIDGRAGHAAPAGHVVIRDGRKVVVQQ